MQILLFARDGVGDQIRDAVTRAFPATGVINTIGNLVSRLKNPFLKPVAVVLIAGSSREFFDIQKMKWLLLDICIILILPDRNKETVTAGYVLQPRYMGCLDDDADNITTVLYKILVHEREGQMKLAF